MIVFDNTEGQSFIEIGDGSSADVAPTGRARIRFDPVTLFSFQLIGQGTRLLLA